MLDLKLSEWHIFNFGKGDGPAILWNRKVPKDEKRVNKGTSNFISASLTKKVLTWSS